MITRQLNAEAILIGSVLFWSAGFLGAPTLGDAQSGMPPVKPAEQVFKNIQILKGVPSNQIIPTMQFISASLGVECEFCHVEGAFDRDDKKEKQTARKMMEMMFSINKNQFEGRREVTCYSCHRGSAHPATVPIIAGGEKSEEHEKKAADNSLGADTKAAIDAILSKYLAAVGGAQRFEHVTSRIQKGTVDLSGRQYPIEIYAKAPDKRASTMRLPNGDSVTAFNGTVGWLANPGRPVQWMSTGESDGAQLDALLALPAKIRQVFPQIELLPDSMIGGKEASVLEAKREGKAPVRLYFDRDSALLVRMVRFAETPVGLNPTQIDYADYRDVSGIRIPFRWTISRPRGTFTIQIEQVQPNVPVDDKLFALPK